MPLLGGGGEKIPLLLHRINKWMKWKGGELRKYNFVHLHFSSGLRRKK